MSAFPFSASEKVLGHVGLGLQLSLATTFLGITLIAMAGGPSLLPLGSHQAFASWLHPMTVLLAIATATALLRPGYGAYGTVLLGATLVVGSQSHLFLLKNCPTDALLLPTLLLPLLLRHGQALTEDSPRP